MSASEELQVAVAWCDVHGARATWSEDHSSCRIELELPGSDPSRITVEGADFLKAVTAVRAAYRAVKKGTRTKAMRRPGG